MARTISVEIVGDAKGLSKAFADASGQSSKFGRAVGTTAKVAGGVAVAGFAALAAGVKVGVGEFMESQKVQAQTAAALKSTGAAANVSAQHISDLAGALLKKSGVDDEAIQSGENLLLTFRNVRNEVGAGNDIFDQATKATLDMSTAMGQDMKSSAILVGKALNDPVKGLSALQRVGVTFTQSQRDAIKAMVATGDAAGAQKVILGELQKEFGGSAEAAGKTFSGQLNVAKETLNNLAGSLVGQAMPALSGLLQGFNNNLPAIERFVSGVADRVKPALAAVWAAIQTNVLPVLGQLRDVFTTTVSRIAAVLEQNRPALTQIWENLKTLLAAVGNVIQTVVLPVLKVALENVLPAAINAVLPVLARFSDAWRLIAAVIRDVKAAVETSISAVLAGIDRFLGGIQAMAAAAGHLPGIGGKFDGVADAVGRARDKVQALRDAIDGVHSKDVTVTVTTITQEMRGNAPTGFSARAAGGPVFAGQTYLVGERGPELFTASQSGRIIPNGGTAATVPGRALNVTINVEGSVVTEGQLVETVRRGLIRTGRRTAGGVLGGLA